MEKNCYGTEKLLRKSVAAKVVACMGPSTRLASSLVGRRNKEMQVGFTHLAGFRFPASFTVL